MLAAGLFMALAQSAHAQSSQELRTAVALHRPFCKFSYDEVGDLQPAIIGRKGRPIIYYGNFYDGHSWSRKFEYMGKIQGGFLGFVNKAYHEDICVLMPQGGQFFVARSTHLEFRAIKMQPITSWAGVWTRVTPDHIAPHQALFISDIRDSVIIRGYGYNDAPSGRSWGDFQAMGRPNGIGILQSTENNCISTMRLINGIIVIATQNYCGGFNVDFAGHFFERDRNAQSPKYFMPPANG